jgi:hypothetical protein
VWPFRHCHQEGFGVFLDNVNEVLCELYFVQRKLTSMSFSRDALIRVERLKLLQARVLEIGKPID